MANEDADPRGSGAKEKTPAKASSRWHWPSKRTMFWAAAGALLIGTAVIMASRAAKDDETPLPPRGRPLCPQSPVPTAGLRIGDYVVVVLQDRAETFQEMAWGQVLSRAPEGDRFLIRLLGTTGEAGGVELAKKKHGYRIGTEIKIDANCIWDTMHAPDVGGKGQLYCGFAGEELGGEEPIAPSLEIGDEVQVLVSSIIGSDAHAEPLWVRVDGISRTGHIVYGTVFSPITQPIHGFRQWMKIEFTRDCIFDWRRP